MRETIPEELKKACWSDPPQIEGAPAATHKSILIPGKRGRLLSLLYLPAGDGPHPLVLTCHGFPGNEQNLDIVQVLRRVGFAAASFHYSGSWGSDGAYSVSNCLEDTDTVLAYLISHAGELRLDPKRLYLFGHSLGGFVAVNTFARHKELKAAVAMSPADFCAVQDFTEGVPEYRERMIEFLGNGACWLNGTSGTALYEDIAGLKPDCLFLSRAEAVSDRPFLVISAEHDDSTPYRHHQKPLLEELDRLGTGNHSHLHYDTGHGYEDHRIEISEQIAAFFLRADGRSVSRLSKVRSDSIIDMI